MTHGRRGAVDPSDPVEVIDAAGRRAVAAGVVCGVPLMAALLAARGGSDPVVAWGYPPVMLHLLAYAWVLVRRPALAAAMTRVTLVVLDVAWLVMTWVRVTSADDATAAWLSLFPMSFMGVVVFVAIAYLDRSFVLAAVHGVVLVGAFVTVTATALLSHDDGAAFVVDLARYAAYVGVLVVLLTVISRWRARVADAVAEAHRATVTAGRMRDMAYLDELTGVANRRRLVEEIRHQAGRVGRAHPVAVVYFDLDRFKAVNDALGHAVGDDVLRVVARVAAEVVREGDLVARLGGEEFVVVAPGADRDRAVQLAERLRQLLPQEVSVAVGVRVTASFGVATLRRGEEAEDVLGRVDELMYEAKEAGRDRVTSAPAEPGA